jgi:hypothetical protein
MATPVAACEPKSSWPCVISLALQYTIRPLRRFEEHRVVMKWIRPLCGPASMSQNDFKTSKTIHPQEASPMKHHITRVCGG